MKIHKDISFIGRAILGGGIDKEASVLKKWVRSGPQHERAGREIIEKNNGS